MRGGRCEVGGERRSVGVVGRKRKRKKKEYDVWVPPLAVGIEFEI
jgi:hypothetical protein